MPQQEKPIIISPTPRTVRADTEYVGADPRRSAWAYAQGLPYNIDDVTRDFGTDLYERMMNDPQVASCVEVIKSAVIAEGIQLVPACRSGGSPHTPGDGTETPEEAMCEWVEGVIRNMDTSIDSVLYDMMDAVALGHKIAENIYTIRDGALVLRAIKVKSRETLSIVVDQFKNIVGFQANIPGRMSQSGSMLVYGAGSPEGLLPRAKFSMLTFRRSNEDPRGRSILRAAYNTWWIKQQVWQEYLKYLSQFGNPTVVAEIDSEQPRNTTVYPLSDGTQGSLREAIQEILLQFRGGSAMTLPPGVTATVLQADPRGGETFQAAIDMLDAQIAKSILTQTLATEQGKNQARAAAQVHQDILGTMIRQIRKTVAGMVERDIIKPMILYNFGEKAARELAPSVRLGEVEQQDWPSTARAVSMLMKVGLEPAQRDALLQKIGLPASTGVAQVAVPADIQNNPDTMSEDQQSGQA